MVLVCHPSSREWTCCRENLVYNKIIMMNMKNRTIVIIILVLILIVVIASITLSEKEYELTPDSFEKEFVSPAERENINVAPINNEQPDTALDANANINIDVQNIEAQGEGYPNVTSQPQLQLPAATNGDYLSYNSQNLAIAQENGRAVLFFHAKWCPTCRAADETINRELDQIPADVTILKVDYDKEKDLKKKYRITYQHTFVQVDENGNEVTKFSGHRKVRDIVSNLE